MSRIIQFCMLAAIALGACRAGAGYAHRVWSNGWSAVELGAQPTFYSAPVRLAPLYGAHALGVAALLHWRIGR